MKNILVVECDHKFRRLLCQFLRDNNFHVIEANNIFMGSYLANEQYPDLIIYSLEIIEEIGYQTFQNMHENSTPFQIPLIFLTKNTEISYSLKKISQMGAGILLKKTVGFNRILEVIQIQLDKSVEDFHLP
ncbi:response regulator [Fischerella thermalis BR2B]|uniref:Response regulator receiver n=1 Tax=Fischerella thermalis JSC-11 TaxID=741277 RepID=G6FY76_9CYAN|nr:response regulator [Fischerella thermalis]EHC09653.1 response regulator receiver [Fischerella thermalis JSC-11]PMB35005.1 response regulator [Fischerella thermalis BR2B]PMB37388.1 response regulator [Fischerella thermalis CCMEE 5208]